MSSVIRAAMATKLYPITDQRSAPSAKLYMKVQTTVPTLHMTSVSWSRKELTGKRVSSCLWPLVSLCTLWEPCLGWGRAEGHASLCCSKRTPSPTVFPSYGAIVRAAFHMISKKEFDLNQQEVWAERPTNCLLSSENGSCPESVELTACPHLPLVLWK